MSVAEKTGIEDLISTSDAGRRLGVSSETVRRLIYAGTLPAEKTRLGYLVDPEVVDDLHDQRRQDRLVTALDGLMS